MTLVTTQNTGYLEPDYLDGPYLGGANFGNSGLQFLAQIDTTKSHGLQFEGTIATSFAQGLQFLGTITYSGPQGIQFQGIIDYENVAGLQAEAIIAELSASGLQARAVISDGNFSGIQFSADLDSGEARGLQFDAQIGDVKAIGIEFRADKGIYHHFDCDGAGYLEGGYLEDAYLTSKPCAHMGLQFEVIGTTHDAEGLEFRSFIDAIRSTGVQALAIIDTTKAYGVQFLAVLNASEATGVQAEGHISTGLVSGLQALGIINAISPAGLQFDSLRVAPVGLQFNSILYNTTNLRILCDFVSRGSDGDTWVSNSTAPGHFNPNNLNTDVVEEVWRSNGDVTGVSLTCDTQIAQGAFVDTLALLNHNLTTSASVTLLASNDPTFSVVGETIPLIMGREENFYYIAPTFPLNGYRYWRFLINDVTNPDGYLQIGTIVFGSSVIFQGECFVDEVGFTLQDFADTVRTAGFRNIANSRAIKKKLNLEFRFLNYSKVNFRQMRQMFLRERTTLTCLWIPTPDINDQEYTARFAVFGKLASIPRELHKSLGRTADYVSFDIEVDESL